MENPFDKKFSHKETNNFVASGVGNMAYNLGRLTMSKKCAEYGPHLMDVGGFLVFDDDKFVDTVAAALGYKKGTFAYKYFRQGAMDELNECMGGPLVTHED